MKESWMEKLIELLNKFIKGKKHYHWTFKDKNDVSKYDCLIIFKQFLFIKWLVDNNMIDLDACEWEKTYNNLTASRDSNYSQYERLLMTLSIQDNPIEFLIGILK